MSILLPTPFEVTLTEIFTLTKCEIALSVTRLLSKSILKDSGKEAIALRFKLRYDAHKTLKTHHHSVSGSINREPPGRPEMSSLAVKTPVHRSKAHNPEVLGSNPSPATHKNAGISGVFCLSVQPGS